jgi:diguanylate cyclase (GGDEF)-like protein
MLEPDCDVCTSATMQGLRVLQHDVLESLARGKPLEFSMGRLCRHAEKLAPEVVCSVLSVDAAGRLHTVAAPSLPQHYSAAIDDMAIGPDAGSCGAAAHLGVPVEVTDIATDRRWTDYKDLALPLGLRACWSSPIHASDGRVIGTFAFYYRSCRGASPLDRSIVSTCVHLCAIALEQEERKASIRRLAFHDPVTGAANRVALDRHGESAVSAATESGSRVAIHCIDLDNFKEVNDTLGHRAGDLLLRAVADRISSIVRTSDFVARVGGDEFVVVQSPVDSAADIEALASRLIAALSAPVDVEDATTTIGASIGVACAPDHGDDLDALMKKADLALYEAKTSGRGSFQIFDTRIESRIVANRRIRKELKEAIQRSEFDLYFQPIVDLRERAVSAFEALIRWPHPHDGMRLPAHFLPIAEKAGMIDEIGRWVLKRACALAASLPGAARVCVNLSPLQLEKPDFAQEVEMALAQSGLAPERLELEITETTLLIENAATSACLHELRRAGVSIALDDFGTGCSALSHLRAFPIDRIKIDRSFVAEIVARPETAAIVRMIVNLARDLGVKTTAEGVETKAQLDRLRQLGCDEIQGYLISRPQPIEVFRAPARTASRIGPDHGRGFADMFQRLLEPASESPSRSDRIGRLA